MLGGALLVELLIALLGTGLKAVDGDGAPYEPGPRTFGTPAYIGKLLLTRFLLVFEVASFLLLIAAVGAVVLARRRGGIGEDDEDARLLTPLDLLRPRGTGTMPRASATAWTCARARAGRASTAASRVGAPTRPRRAGRGGQALDGGSHERSAGIWRSRRSCSRSAPSA